MAKNEDQHFVPQLYLRNFSADCRSIGMVNLKQRKGIDRASIAGQCQRPYLYGKDLRLENLFGKIEGRISPLIREILDKRIVPTVEAKSHQDMLFFIASQNLRTTQSAAEMNEMLDKMMKHLIGPQMEQKGISKEDMSKVRVQWTHPYHNSFIAAMDAHVLLFDLHPMLFVNKTGRGFVTSDHPTVFYNQLLEQRRHSSNVGFLQVGLQIFLPLSADVLLCYYDPKCYGFGRRQRTTVELSNDSDVIQLNNLQFISAQDNVYFDPRRNKVPHILASYDAVMHLRRGKTANLHTQLEPSDDPTTKRELLGMYREDVRANLTLTPMKVLPSARKSLDQLLVRVFTPRNEFMYQRDRTFTELVKQGKYKKGQFIKFLRESEQKQPPAAQIRP